MWRPWAAKKGSGEGRRVLGSGQERAGAGRSDHERVCSAQQPAPAPAASASHHRGSLNSKRRLFCTRPRPRLWAANLGQPCLELLLVRETTTTLAATSCFGPVRVRSPFLPHYSANPPSLSSSRPLTTNGSAALVFLHQTACPARPSLRCEQFPRFGAVPRIPACGYLCCA